MKKYRFKKDGEGEYFSFRGRWFDYVYGNAKPEYALRIGETTDYFYFAITSLYDSFNEEFTIHINQEDILYNAFNNLMEGFNVIDVMEEGSPEGKVLKLNKQKKNINITFKIGDKHDNYCVIELANARRWGDTRFANIASNDDKDFINNLEKMREFRYGFKRRLHILFDELEELYNSQIKGDVELEFNK